MEGENCPLNSLVQNNKIGGPMTRSVKMEKQGKSSGSSSNGLSKHETNKKMATASHQSVFGPRVTRSVTATFERDENKKKNCTRSRSRFMSSQ